MRPLTLLVLFFLSVFEVTGSQAEDSKPDPREKLETAIPMGIKLLTAKEFKPFIEKFVAPDDLKEITKRTTIEEFAKRFGEEKAETLLKVLENIKDTKPTFDKTETKATYTLTQTIGNKKTITFKKVEKYWYIQN